MLVLSFFIRLKQSNSFAERQGSMFAIDLNLET